MSPGQRRHGPSWIPTWPGPMRPSRVMPAPTGAYHVRGLQGEQGRCGPPLTAHSQRRETPAGQGSGSGSEEKTQECGDREVPYPSVRQPVRHCDAHSTNEEKQLPAGRVPGPRPGTPFTTTSLPSASPGSSLTWILDVLKAVPVDRGQRPGRAMAGHLHQPRAPGALRCVRGGA